MSRFARSKEKTDIVLIICLFFITTELISEVSGSQSDAIVPEQLVLIASKEHENHTWLSQEKRSMIDFALVPIPGIFTQLARLAGASSQQPLDSAFNLPKELPKMKEISARVKFRTEQSSLIKNPLSFKKTLQQIIQQLTKALKTINTNSDQISSKMKEAIKYIDTVIQNPISNQEFKTLIDSMSLPLNRLKELSEKFLVLSSQNSAELQKMANMTEAFAEAVYDIHAAKLEYKNGPLEKQVNATNNRKVKLENEIISLKEELEHLEFHVTKSEKKFNQRWTRYLDTVRKYQKNPKDRECLENEAKNWNSTSDVYTACKAKSTRMERKNMRTVFITKFTWQTFLQALNETQDDIGQKEEELVNLLFSVHLLEQKKSRLDQDIVFLSSTTNWIDELENNLEELIFDGWNNLVSLCLEFQSSVSTIRATLLPDNKTSDTKKSMPSEKILKEINQQLIKTAKEMSTIGKTVSVYLVAYESDLAPLVVQLERMTKGDEVMIELEEKLIKSCVDTAREIETILAMKSEE